MFDVDLRPKRHMSWLRKSMRKTKPINIPDRDVSPVSDGPIYENTDFFTSGESNSIVQSNSIENRHQTTMASNEDLTFKSFNTVYFDACDTLPRDTVPLSTTVTMERASSSHVPRIELRNDDILNVILNSSTESGSSDDARPRQMGRRSEPRPRVVSIDATTPQRQTISMQGAVPFTAPTTRQSTSGGNRQYLAPPVSQHQTPPPFQSENSSIQSSRNPSPVSLVSSTGSSSVASAVDNNQR